MAGTGWSDVVTRRARLLTASVESPHDSSKTSTKLCVQKVDSPPLSQSFFLPSFRLANGMITSFGRISPLLSLVSLASH